ncbi:hypothetical protein AALB16_03055 [Lachnospiraceae bacterium 62-35]
MNRIDELKKAYRALQAEEAPDLWPRIEAALEKKKEEAANFQQIEIPFCVLEKEEAQEIQNLRREVKEKENQKCEVRKKENQEEEKQKGEVQKSRCQKKESQKREKLWKKYGIPVRAAAACCLIFIVGALSINGIRIIKRWGEEIFHSDYAIMEYGETMISSETMAVPKEGNERAEDEDMQAGGTGNMQMEAGEGIVAGETEGEWKAEAEGMEENGSTAHLISGGKIVSYKDLALSGIWIQPPEGRLDSTVALSHPFKEEKAKETDLLIQAKVTKVSYQKNKEGIIDEITYELETKQILYSEGYWNQGQTVQVKSPLEQNSQDSMPAYGLKQGGNYILPLKEEEGEWELVFPFAPQIEVTEDGKYLFYSGWKSLLNAETAVVQMEDCRGGEDEQEGKCQDFMVLREDSVFLKELTALVR